MHPQQTCYPFQLSHGHPLLLHVNKKAHSSACAS